MRLLPLLAAALLATVLPSSAEAAAPAPKLAEGSNALGYDLFPKLPPGNAALSPVSIELALAMTAAGARGDTAEQMKAVMHLDGAAPEAWGPMGAALVDHGAELRVANRLFVARSLPLEQPFREITARAFGAPAETTDFGADPEGARRRINGWVGDQTKQRIRELVPPGGIDGGTRLTLVNAIYMLADWDVAFERSNTSEDGFHLDASHTKKVPTMHRTGSLKSGAAEGVRVVQLPYKKGTLAMTVIVPDAVDGLAAFESKLSTATIATLDAAMAQQSTVVALPRFTIDPAPSFSLGSALASLGMRDAFDASHANFGGIVRTEGLAIGNVFHKAFVKVDEKGTEAAAATAITVGVTSAMPAPQPFVITADRPFLFLVRDTATGLVLFLGRVVEPK